MTLRTLVYAFAALVVLPAQARAVGGATSPIVSVDAPATAALGTATSVVCAASDPDGIAQLTLTAVGPDGAAKVLVIASGVTATSAQWTPAMAGASAIRCESLSLSGDTVVGSKTVTVSGTAAAGPVISGLSAPGSAVLAGKAVSLAVTAKDPAGGALAYGWSATGGTVASSGGAFATWTAPATAGAYVVKVTATDSAGRSVSRTANINVVISVYQQALPVQVVGPRKVAATSDGTLFVADKQGRLHRLTRRGERMSTSLTGVTSVATGPGVVFAGLAEGAVLRIDAASGRVVGRMDLGTAEGPAGMSYDAVRGKLWLAFASGSLQARTLDGKQVNLVASAGTSSLRRHIDVAVDPGGVVWVAQDRTDTDGTIYSFNGDTGAYLKSIGNTAASTVRVSGGLAVGAGGKLYVSDLFSGKVQVLAADGSLVGSVGSYGTAAGQLRQPAGMAFMANGDLVVANMDANRLERFGANAALPTCPGDSDCDGLPDAWEIANGLDPHDPTDALGDPDADGLNNLEEYALGTNPRSKDTDGDGFSDRDEMLAGFDPTNPDDHRPTLVASAPAAVNPGLVRLSAVVSSAKDGSTSCATTWDQVAGPKVALGGASTATPSFVARAAATYQFRASSTCGGVASLPQTVSLDVRNVPPRAEAGGVRVVPAGGTVDLSGAFSSDANGDLLAFAWDQLLGDPAIGSSVGPAVSARVDTAGYYVFRLGATDPKGAEGAAEVPVVVVGDAPAPTALAVSPLTAKAGDQVILDASASYHGAGAVFTWQQLEGPAVTLDNAASVAPAFVPPAPGRYVFQVGIQDGGLSAPPAKVEVYVAAAGGALPVAQIQAPAVVAAGAPVTLDGSASAGAGSLGFAWRQVSGPAAGLNDADQASATVVPFDAGSYAFELTVNDAGAVSLPALVRLEARAGSLPIPVAVASAPGTAVVGERVVLDARGSTGALGYRWTQVDGPWVVVVPGAVGAFTPQVPGVYGFELSVDDGAVRSAPARVNVVVFQNGVN